jgi:hypothetical protein
MTRPPGTDCQSWQHLRDKGGAQTDNGIVPNTPEEFIPKETS